MKFTSIILKNFRNFENVEVKLDNKNVVFGLNDIGKSNFLASIRYLLDSSYRKNGLIDSDFYLGNCKNDIEITLKIDISNFNEADSRKIRTMMKGSITSESNEIYIQLKSKYNPKTLCGDIYLYWGVDYDNLDEVPSNQSRYELDKYFNIVYIDSAVSLEKVFKKYTREIFKGEGSISDEEIGTLNKNIIELNSNVSKLSTISKLKSEIVDEYKRFRDESSFDITIQSEMEIGNLYTKLVPYIQDESKKSYPTSGDGRKKLLAYTLLTLENRKIEDEKINVFLVEELENHLHRSVQIELSYQLFTDNLYKYMFLTTHSSLLVSQMDNVNLIKLYKENKIIGKSYIYNVPKEYAAVKHKLNQNLAEAIYANVVMLVEGPSEKTIFECILREKCPIYEAKGGYILEVQGINFKSYVDVLKSLGVDVIIKTDNDMQKVRGQEIYYFSGANRCASIIQLSKRYEGDNVDSKKYKENTQYVLQLKKDFYDSNSELIATLEEQNVFLSKVD
ncbi:MAG: AAA family ATPase, partial [Peptostreptococcaceae bacterium]